MRNVVIISWHGNYFRDIKGLEIWLVTQSFYYWKYTSNPMKFIKIKFVILLFFSHFLRFEKSSKRLENPDPYKTSQHLLLSEETNFKSIKRDKIRCELIQLVLNQLLVLSIGLILLISTYIYKLVELTGSKIKQIKSGNFYLSLVFLHKFLNLENRIINSVSLYP